MSHITKLNMKILLGDTEILNETCNRLGFKLIKADTFNWHGGKSKCDMKIKVPDVSHEVGLVDTGKGYYEVQCDTYGGLGSKIGQGGNILIQEFTADKVEQNALMRGWAVTKENEKGKIFMTLVR